MDDSQLHPREAIKDVLKVKISKVLANVDQIHDQSKTVAAQFKNSNKPEVFNIPSIILKI